MFMRAADLLDLGLGLEHVDEQRADRLALFSGSIVPASASQNLQAWRLEKAGPSALVTSPCRRLPLHYGGATRRAIINNRSTQPKRKRRTEAQVCQISKSSGRRLMKRPG
jgi:hypothetical protein